MSCDCYPALRSMDTAPKDGTSILATFASPYANAVAGVPRTDVRVINWSGWGGGVWDTDTGHHLTKEPIGWRPLPQPVHGCMEGNSETEKYEFRQTR